MDEATAGPRLRTPDERRAEHPYCRECRLLCEKAGRDWAKTASNCVGIMLDEEYEYLAAATGMTVAEVRSVYDVTTWVRENLLFEPFWYQDRVLRCTSSRRVLRQGRRCLEENTPVLLANGRWKPIKDIEIGDRVIARSAKNSTLVEATVLAKIDNGIQETYSIGLADGTSIQATAGHKFLEGIPLGYQKGRRLEWRSIETGLKVGSKIQTVQGYPVFGSVNEPDMAFFLGLMVTDGYMNGDQTPKFTNTNRKIIDDMKAVAKTLFGIDCTERIKGNGWDVHLTDGNRGTANPVKASLIESGVFGKKAHVKCLPNKLWEWDAETVAAFVRGMLAGDGSISAHERSGNRLAMEVNLTTASIGVARDFQCLMRKIGAVGRIDKTVRMTPVSKVESVIYKVRFSRADSILKILDFIGTVPGKEPACSLVREFCIKKMSKVRPNGSASNCQRTHLQACKGIRIRSISQCGQAHVYDLEVEKHHNFIAAGIVSHNSGKTQTVMAWLLREAFTNDGVKVVVITPMKSQAEDVYNRLHEYIDASPEMLRETRSKKQPYFEISFRNGSRIRIFIAGTSEGANAATQVRGQEADIIFIDEMDFMSEDAATAIMPLLSDPQRRGEPVRFVGSSTPSGKEGTFFRLCGDPYYREFLIPAPYRPDWTDKMEAECRTLAKTQRNYAQEYLAEWGTKADGVFRRDDVITAMRPYRYDGVDGVYEQTEWPKMSPWPHWTYVLGADWNGKGTGTRLVVVGFDPVHEKWLVVYRETIDLSQFALHVAVERIVALNRTWRCHAVYIDAGFGQMQDEYLRRIGRLAQEARAAGAEYERADLTLAERLQAVDFGSSFEYEIDDPQTGKLVKVKKRLKNYIVENAQRHFELHDLWFSMADTDLKQQLIGYTAPRTDAHGQLIYEGDPEAGDHDLDALLLSLYGFNREFDPEFQKRIDSRIVLAQRPGQNGYDGAAGEMPDPTENPAAYRDWLDAQHGRSPLAAESRAIDLPQQATAGLPPLPQGLSYRLPRPAPGRVQAFGGGRIPSRNAWRSASRSRNGLW